MLDITQPLWYQGVIRFEKKVKITNPVAVIKEGSCVKLDSNNEVVLTGNNAAVEDCVFWAWTSANDPDNYRGDYVVTGGVTIVQGVFVAETDQYDVNASYTVGTKLASENGVLFPADTGDYVCGYALKMPIGNKLEFIAKSRLLSA